LGLEQGPLSLTGITEELLQRKSSGSSLENRDYGHRDSSRSPCGTTYPQKLAQTSLTNSDCSVGIVRSWTQATEFLSVSCSSHILINSIHYHKTNSRNVLAPGPEF
jgi:hypothetical protein